ncbi:MAG TPA: hypothetical protein VF698_02965 [Thermoanaerobaculia bacterium]|jgi:hypothetical protein
MKQFVALLFALRFALPAFAQMPVSGAVPVTAPVAGAAFDRQNEAVVATNGTDFLVVWADEGAGADVYAARVAADGTVLDPIPILLPPTFARDFAPRVLWNGSNYVVVYSSDFGLGVVAVEIDGDGRVVSSRTLFPASFRPAIAWNGSTYLITWRTDQRVLAARFDRAFDQLGPALDFGAGDVPAVASNGSGFLVTWTQNATTAGYAAINADGLVLERGGLSVTGPAAVASDGVHYLVVAEKDDVLQLTRMTSGGQVDAVTPLVSNRPMAFPAVAWNGIAYVLSWIETGAGTADVVAAEVFSGPAGVRVIPGSVGAPLPASAAAPSIAVSRDRTLLVWSDVDVRGMFLRDARPEGDDFLVSYGLPRQSPQAAAAAPDGTFGVVWIENGRTLMFGRIGPDARPLDGAGIPLANGGASAARIAFANDVYLVVWYDEFGQPGVLAKRVARDGRVLDAEPIVISATGSRPSVATDGRDFAVVFSEFVLEPPPFRKLLTYASRIGTDGTRTAAARISPDEAPRSWPISWQPRDLVWTGSEYMALLQRREVSGCPHLTCIYDEELHLQPLTRELQLARPMLAIARRAALEGNFSDADLAAGATELLVTYDAPGGRGVTAQRFTLAGLPLDSPFTFASLAYAATPLWNGRQFVVVTNERYDPLSPGAFFFSALVPIAGNAGQEPLVLSESAMIAAAVGPRGHILLLSTRTDSRAAPAHYQGVARAYVRFAGGGGRTRSARH